MAETNVETFYNNSTTLLSLLTDSGEISLQVWASDYLRRFLVVVSATYFETEIIRILKDLASSHSTSVFLKTFVHSTVDRQFFNYFDWHAQNANKFFSLFGDQLKGEVAADVASNSYLDDAIKAFMEICRTRNGLVHDELNLETADLPKTTQEYFELFQKGLTFLDYLEHKLTQFS